MHIHETRVVRYKILSGKNMNYGELCAHSSFSNIKSDTFLFFVPIQLWVLASYKCYVE